jgi:hypothetical protein
MNEIKLSTLSQSSVLYLYSERETIDLDPDYQRESDVWPIAKRQLLIDSIINGFDIPKFYFQEYHLPKEKSGKLYRFGVIDGKQRLATIWKFISGDLALSDEVKYYRDVTLNLSGMTYQELASKHPNIKIRFDSYVLSVVCINSSDDSLIEEMFFRLNEAEPLNAAEKRNAKSGPITEEIRKISKHFFFTTRIGMKEKRYNFLDLSAKFLLFEKENKTTDTKRIKLDEMVEKVTDPSLAKSLSKRVQKVLSKMSECFTENDTLLKSVGMITVYYLFFRHMIADNELIDRSIFVRFEETRKRNKNQAEQNNGQEVSLDLIQFDKLSQSPNDRSALDFRLKVLTEFFESEGSV